MDAIRPILSPEMSEGLLRHYHNQLRVEGEVSGYSSELDISGGSMESSPSFDELEESSALSDLRERFIAQRLALRHVVQRSNTPVSEQPLSKTIIDPPLPFRKRERLYKPVPPAEIEIWDASGSSKQLCFSSISRFSGTSNTTAHRVRVTLPKIDGCYRDLFQEHIIKDDSEDAKYQSVIKAYVHDPIAFNNAFWSDQLKAIFIGQTDEKIFSGFENAIEVIAHELMHAKVEELAGLMFQNQSGSLCESICDVFGLSVKQRLLKESLPVDANWKVGEVLKGDSASGCLRCIDQPGKAYDHPIIGKDSQPDHYSRYNELPNTRIGDWGGVHINSSIPSKAFYNVCTRLNSASWSTPIEIWIETLRRSERNEKFGGFAGKTVQCAKSLHGERIANEVGMAWSAVGVSPTL